VEQALSTTIDTQHTATVIPADAGMLAIELTDKRRGEVVDHMTEHAGEPREQLNTLTSFHIDGEFADDLPSDRPSRFRRALPCGSRSWPDDPSPARRDAAALRSRRGLVYEPRGIHGLDDVSPELGPAYRGEPMWRLTRTSPPIPTSWIVASIRDRAGHRQLPGRAVGQSPVRGSGVGVSGVLSGRRRCCSWWAGNIATKNSDQPPILARTRSYFSGS
jgi:hypothetical protein